MERWGGVSRKNEWLKSGNAFERFTGVDASRYKKRKKAGLFPQDSVS
jgi:hypothetical protein